MRWRPKSKGGRVHARTAVIKLKGVLAANWSLDMVSAEGRMRAVVNVVDDSGRAPPFADIM